MTGVGRGGDSYTVVASDGYGSTNAEQANRQTRSAGAAGRAIPPRWLDTFCFCWHRRKSTDLGEPLVDVGAVVTRRQAARRESHRMKIDRDYKAKKVSANGVEQDPPVLEQGGVVPENRKGELALSPLEQVEQGNSVSADKETNPVVCSLEMRDTCLPCSSCSTPLKTTAVMRFLGTPHPVPPCEGGQGVAEVRV